MNIRHLSAALLACAVLQACTTAAPPAAPPPPSPPPVAQPAPPPPVPMPPPPPEVAPPLPPAAEAPRDPLVDPRGLCDGRAEGARVQMTGPRGERIAGVCRRGANGWLQFNPEPRR
ncbi:hypothetical protein [Variovorax fucosicus]|uniref:hypothetical protein n=1 Tax=Variovorax fucosicus TaxID=3053517 RepID=UPI0025752816|nr:hypothetical protein [Variovorax sp. J22G47]MDM0059309.1 hypothetical protein [Variovorax sp. J22G47]